MNEKEVRGVFSDMLPQLERLSLHRAVVTANGRIDLYLNFIDLPSHIPDRWRQRGCEILQVHFSIFGANDLKLADLRQWQPCSLNLSEDKITIISAVDVVIFECCYTDISATFLPSEMRQAAAALFQNPLID